MRFVLLFSDTKTQWRHSSHSKVWLHNVNAKTTYQLGTNKTNPSLATAEWSQRNYISFVENNNLFLIKDVNQPTKTISITTDGTKDIFNAIPDWVYEEEVFSGDTTHWWSPDGNRVAYLRLDETKVQTYSFPIYNPTEINGKASLYPSTVDMKYPKPGTPNPTVSVFVYDVVTGIKSELHQPPTKTVERQAADLQPSIETATVNAAFKAAGDSVMVTQMVWTNDMTLIMRETNRMSDAMRFVTFDCSKVNKTADSPLASILGTVSRQEYTAAAGGWIPASQNVHRVKVGASPGSTAYVDLIAEPKGYRHIAYFKDSYQRDPVYLTSGEWEVDKINFVFGARVYFTAAYPRPAVRHIMYVDIPNDIANVKPTEKPASLTDTRQTAWHEITFDPKGNYYQLSYLGPHVPWVKILSLRDLKFEITMEDNAKLQNTVAQYQQPQRLHYNITTADGIIVSAEEWRPHDFDSSGSVRYPVLINVYGGPDSQVVQSKWAMNSWRTYLTCSLGYIVILLDGRGTGYRGRGYRDLVTWRLGVYESLDVVQAAEQIRRLPYVAQSKVGIWGWSYGGYLTAKTLERDTGTFDLGMSVAPVSRWEFYDSIYTERYMKTPHINKAGYENSSIHVNKGFENSQFLLAQGSADDNVHFQSSAYLLDQLTAQKIRSFWFRMFPDSSHNISTRGAFRELHEFMTRFLVYNWGAGGRRILRYEHDKGEDLSIREMAAVRQ
jgi:dipeptidyl aminopeptidase